MTQPPGYEQGDKSRFVCKLNKAIYGLKQAPRAWFETLKAHLLSLGFVMTRSDSSLFVRHSVDEVMYLLVYVDDIILTGNNLSSIQVVIDEMNRVFSLKDLGVLSYFLGIEITYVANGFVLSQQKYIRDLLHRCGMESANGLPTPMISNCHLSLNDGSPIPNVTEYRSIVGALQYVVITRPEIAFSVNRVCQFMHSPLDTHFQAVKRILRYLSGTVDFGLHFVASSRLTLTAFVDANWGSDLDDRRSTSGFCVFFGDNPVSWGSKKQAVVSRSTAEAEYRSVACATTELLWLESLLRELRVSLDGRSTLWCDNSSAVAVSANPVFHSKFKHVELDLFFVREQVAAGRLLVNEIPSSEQLADVLTKPLSASSFSRFRERLSVVQLSSVL
ncbi:cysteine-rich RLK (RECEPTOR-like protein kinase) 8 [Hibiscus trionum]|uniref:Cysteine-rich RLK (RECEPTOR-like protein kinase) 8 n=1 Tax=Hibiscus trionum TaxID=183268 RepID=A0A9W7IHR1_HIBTR|nr:cysteine-rich RLK (RECEPTOR-like protein kinase) 8 [Hibiscus trionum]